MKRSFLVIALSISILITATSCGKKDGDTGGGEIPQVDHSFTSQTLAGVYKTDQPILQEDEFAHQISSNRSTSTFRIQSDNQSEYFSCQLSTLPQAVGETLTATIKTRGFAPLDSDTYTLKVVAIRDQTYWLWSDASGVGFVVRFE